MDRNEGRPVLTGLVALVGVGLAVGLILGGGALAATRVLGLGDSGDDTGSAGAQQSMYLPDPVETTPTDLPPSQQPTPAPSAPETSKTPETEISLQAAQAQVGPMQNIDLTGSYAQGEGAILQVQRFENGSWGDFPVTVPVNAGSFSTYIQTGQSGKNRFRVLDPDSGLASNEVTVTIG